MAALSVAKVLVYLSWYFEASKKKYTISRLMAVVLTSLVLCLYFIE